jgi:hypothetical protein
MDEFEKGLMGGGDPVEARAWLALSDGVTRTLGELSTVEASRALVDQFYRAGALRVLAIEIHRSVRETLHEDEVRENTGHLVVQLPADPKHRARVFKLQGREAKRCGYDPTKDIGQNLLYVKLD